MKTIDYFNMLYSVITISIMLYPYRKDIKTKLNEIYNNRNYKIVSNWATMLCSITLVIIYFMSAMLCWVLKFQCSELGFYICNAGIIPVILFSLYFHKATYEIIPPKR